MTDGHGWLGSMERRRASLDPAQEWPDRIMMLGVAFMGPGLATLVHGDAALGVGAVALGIADWVFVRIARSRHWFGWQPRPSIRSRWAKLRRARSLWIVLVLFSVLAVFRR